MTIADLNNATAQLTAAAAAYNGKIANIDSRIAVKEAAVDAFILGAKDNYSNQTHLVFDGSAVQTKITLAATASVANNSMSDWIVVPSLAAGAVVSTNESGRANLSLNKAFSSSPGFYENPKYVVDWSRSWVNFVLASSNATSDEINARIGERAITPKQFGDWGSSSQSGEIPIILPTGKSTLMKLYVRFFNTSNVPANAPQDILSFGGGGTFIVDRLTRYQPL